MESWYLPPLFVSYFCYIILPLTLGVYLLGGRARAAGAGWLGGFCLGFALSLMSWTQVTVLTPPNMPGFPALLESVLGGSGWPMGFWCLMVFAYRFLGNLFPREERYVRLGTGAVVGGVVLSAVFVPLFALYAGAFLGPPLLGWSVVVFARKARRLRREGQPHPARGCRLFAGLCAIFLLVSLSQILTWVYPIYPAFFNNWLWVLVIAGFYGMMVGYATYSPEPMTLQVRLVGATLATVFVLLGALITLAFPIDGVARNGGVVPIPRETLRFVPTPEGSYTATRAPFRFEEELGERIDFGAGEDRVLALGFAFPFYDKTHTEAYLNRHGVLTFGGLIHPVGRDAMGRYDVYDVPHPRLMPFVMALDPSLGGGVFARKDSSRLVLTWHEVVAPSLPPTTVQAVLHADGVVEMRYREVAIGTSDITFFGIRGLHPGDDAPIARLRAHLGGLPLPPGTALIDDLIYEMMRAGHPVGTRLFLLAVAALVFILTLFPLLFRTSLLRPLDALLAGVRRVEAGDLQTPVVVERNDEMGVLAEHFNTMTDSVREAEVQLRAHAETLEARVDERTTALRDSLDELHRTQDQLIHAEKMASLGSLTAGIAHEIKNPLNFINNFAELNAELADELADELGDLPGTGTHLADILADLKQNAAIIATHGKRADGIVQAMMAHARGGEGHREPTDVNALVNEYLGLAYHGQRARHTDFNAELVRDFGEDVGMATMKPQDIGRVLLNLLGNAFDAVYTARIAAPKVTVATRRRGDTVEIRVADNGPGIPDAVRDRIFEPFFTTKPTGQGTGLGLSLSYDIITQGHGGTLAVESQEDAGATFVITLPAKRGGHP